MQNEKNELVEQPKSTAIQRSNLLNQYLAEVRRYPLLSQEEEHELAVRYRDEGDEEAGKKTSHL